MWLALERGIRIKRLEIMMFSNTRRRISFDCLRILGRRNGRDGRSVVGWRGLVGKIGLGWRELEREDGILRSASQRLRGVGNEGLIMKLLGRVLLDGNLRR